MKGLAQTSYKAEKITPEKHNNKIRIRNQILDI